MILIGVGLQRKRADEIAAEMGLPTSQLLGLFNKTVRKVSQYLNSVVEKAVAAELEPSSKKAISFSEPLNKDVMNELDEEAKVSSRFDFLFSLSQLLLHRFLTDSIHFGYCRCRNWSCRRKSSQN